MKFNPKRILIATQGPNKEPFSKEIEVLFQSLNRFGGAMKNSQKIACFTEKPSKLLEKKLKKLDVRIRIVDPIDKRSPHSNKIQMLNLNKSEDFDVLVALDSDIVIAKDFSEFIDFENFCAKPVDHDPFSMKDWERIYDYFKIKFPNERYFTSFRNAETIPYFNSGVLIIPEKYISNLYNDWKFFIKTLLDSYNELPEFKDHSFFTDQIALSLAVAKLKIPKKPLPIEMNFPTNDKIHERFKPEKLTPFLIHYHHFSESQLIKFCNYENVNNKIEQMNISIVSNINLKPKNSNLRKFPKKLLFGIKKQQEFSNSKFWENRYKTNPKLGSGIGSKGEHLAFKKNIILEIIEKYHPKSILDVGCGDLEVTKSLQVKNYTGIDISKTIIKKNSGLKPEWDFFSGNFLDLFKDKNYQSDFVICLDVLIHQHDFEKYIQFVKSLVKSSKKICLISGFNEKPKREFFSNITAFHEPIIQTLKKIGISKYQILGKYRDTTLILIEKE